MSVVLVSSGLLCLLVGQVVCVCNPVDYMIYVEKPECDFCVAINTTVCMGFCRSWDPNVVGLVKKVQPGCTYQVLEYQTAVLPGCPLHVDPRFSYPVARQCTCRACHSAREECTQKAGPDGDGCPSAKPLLHMHTYPGQSNYIQPL